jgi:hypothetical protein
VQAGFAGRLCGQIFASRFLADKFCTGRLWRRQILRRQAGRFSAQASAGAGSGPSVVVSAEAALGLPERRKLTN